MILNYLTLMNEVDNEQIVSAFEAIMWLFKDGIKPFSVEICKHLQQQYLRCMEKTTPNGLHEEGSMTAVASLNSMRRILDVN